MKERPILFEGPMVRALLKGSKTQTRREVKFSDANMQTFIERVPNKPVCCPYGQPGDQLWVREAWQVYSDLDNTSPRDLPINSYVQYAATYGGWVSKKRASIHMPRWASRITLEIVSVRVERLHDISEADAVAEGVPMTQYGCHEHRYPDAPCSTAKQGYQALWESINRPGSWDANPWVWAVEFKRIES